VGGIHEAGSETVSCDLSWFDQRSVKIPECAEVVVFAEGERVPDHIHDAKILHSLLRSFLSAPRLSMSGYIFLRRQLVEESILSNFASLNLRPGYSLGSEQRSSAISQSHTSFRSATIASTISRPNGHDRIAARLY